MSRLPAIFLLLSAILPAQEAPPPPAELLQLRKNTETRALSASRTLADQFSNALAAVIREAGSVGDYETALAAQTRRDTLAALYAKFLNDSSLSNTLVLRPGDARITGAVSHDRTTPALTGWKTVGSVASWDVNKITPGLYDVTLTYGVADLGEMPRAPNPFLPPPDLTTGGAFEFYEDSSLTGASQNRRASRVTSTGGWTDWSTLTLSPPFQLTRTSTRFTLRITQIAGNGGVMHLKEIRLTPAKASAEAPTEPTDPANPDAPPMDELVRLQQGFEQRLRTALAPVLNNYQAALRRLAGADSDPDLAEDIQRETVRLERQLEHPRQLLSGSTARPGSRPAPRSDGFTEVPNAVYTEHLDNAGDFFFVTAGGELFPVRLLWVTCPSPAKAGEELNAALAAHFGIEPGEARTLGQRAAEFTKNYLSGKPLTLLTHGKKNPEGALLVSVRVGSLGDFATVLVDNGLAAINDPRARNPEARQQETAVLNALRERETAAKARPIPPGVWALVKDGDST